MAETFKANAEAEREFWGGKTLAALRHESDILRKKRPALVDTFKR